MPDYSVEDLISLHLQVHSGEGGEDTASYEVSVPGISDALGLEGERMSERIELLSAISNMNDEGLIEEKVMHVEKLRDERKVYFLTPKGEERANELREKIRNETVLVRGDGEEREVALDEMDEYFSGSPVVRTLSKMNRDGVLYLKDEVDEEFVNRKDELEKLERLPESDETAVMIQGEAGIGKTTLVSEIRSRLEKEGVKFLVGECREDTYEPYQPFKEALSDYPEAEEIFSDTAGTEMGEESFEERRDVLFNEVRDFLNELSQDHESHIVVFVDDMHSSDPATVELFAHLLNTATEDVSLIGAYRREDITEDHFLLTTLEEKVDESRYFQIKLYPFGMEETRELIEWTVGKRSVPDDFVELVYEQTGGNPLFVEESVRHMMEEGEVDPDYGIYPDYDDKLEISDQVEDTIDIRLRLLDDKAMDLLREGSIIGGKIPLELLSEVSELDELELRDYIDVLVGSRVWFREDDGNYLRFTSDVIQETILGRMEDEVGSRIHERVAESMIEVYEEDELGHHYDSIAHHYEKAGRMDEALDYYVQAAERDRDMYATEVAVENYENALEIAQELSREDDVISILEEIGHTHYLAGEYDDADRYFDYVWERSQDPETLMRVAHYQARMRVNRGKHDEGIEIADRGLVEWDEKTPSEEVCRLLSAKGWALQEQGDLEEAAEIYEKEYKIAEELGDDERIGWALHDLGSIHMYRDEADEAGKVLKESIDKLEKSGSKHLLSKSINNFGIVHWKNGDLQESKEAFERSLEIDKETGDMVSIPTTLLNLGVISFVMGEWEQTLDYYEESLEKARIAGNRDTVATVSGNLGEVYLDRGELEKALEYFERSIELTRELGIKHTETHILSGLSRYYYARNELDESMAQAEKALNLAEETGATNEKTFALDRMGRTELERSNLEKAREYQEESVELAEGAEERNKVDTRAGLVKIYIASGDVEEAYDVAQETFDIADGMKDFLRKLQSERAFGMAMRETGEYEEAEAKLESALERSRELESKYEEAYTLYEFGLLEDRRGNTERAAEYFNKCNKIAEENGFDLFSKWIREFELESELELESETEMD